MDTVYFDSTIFLAIFAGLGKGSDLRALLRELKRDKVKIYTSIITVQEVSVATFRKGSVVSDNYSKVDKLARIVGINKDIALTAAKYEAHIIDQTSRGDQEDNKRRKWDCFHIATAMDLKCSTLYTLDERMLKRKGHFDITAMNFWVPIPKKRELFDDSAPALEVANGEQQREKIPAKQAEPSSAAVQGSSGGPTEGQAGTKEKEGSKGQQ